VNNTSIFKLRTVKTTSIAMVVATSETLLKHEANTTSITSATFKNSTPKEL